MNTNNINDMLNACTVGDDYRGNHGSTATSGIHVYGRNNAIEVHHIDFETAKKFRDKILTLILEQGTSTKSEDVGDIQSLSLLLWCPECGNRHIDKDHWAVTKHHTHVCQHCGHVWRPAVECTYGVQFLNGFKN